MQNSFRGQAAMEYLVTYGWALLALFAVVAILISTGAFSSSNFSQQECSFQPDLPCSPFIIYKSGETQTSLRYSLTNGLGFPIKIAKITYLTTGIGVAGRQEWDGTADCTPADIVQSGGQIVCASAFDGSAQPQLHDFKTVIITIQYLNCKGFATSAECKEPEASKYTTSGRVSSVVETSTG